MPAIYSEQWYDALKDLINRSKDVRKECASGHIQRAGGNQGRQPLAPFAAR